MDYHKNEEIRKKRSQKLVNGFCDCGAEAQIPWKEYKLCYHCWNLLQNALREIEEAEKRTN